MSVRRQASGRAHYNYFRDYDPAVGRYVESDPIGLEGGLNTFGYVGGNPVSKFDATGEAELALPMPGAGISAAEAAAAAAVAARRGAALARAMAQAASRANPVAAAGAVGIGVGTLVYPYIAIPLGDAIDRVCSVNSSDLEKRTKNCQALKNSILNTCAGLTGRKRFACFAAADKTFRQCMSQE